MSEEVKPAPILHIDASGPVGRNHEVMENGWLKADATLTRTGVFKYTMPDGSVVRQLRLPEEVFSLDAMKSLEMLPITDGHPPVGPLTAANTKQYQVGNIGENIRKDGNVIKARAIVTDANVVKRIISGERAQVSVGYFAEHEEKAGTYQGDSYDVIQRNIRANHVAVCADARGGPDMRFTLDSNADVVLNVLCLDSSSGELMIKFNIDGIDYEVSEPAAQALNKLTAKHAEDIKAANAQTETAKADATKAQAHADSVDAELKKTSAALAAASDPVAIRAVVTARVALESRARDVLGKEFKADSTDLDLKIAVIEKLDGDKLTRKDSVYVDARFDGAVAHATAFKPAGDRFVADPKLVTDSAPNAEEARQRMLKEQEGLYKKGTK